MLPSTTCVTVSFSKVSSLTNLPDLILSFKNAQLILWYFGCHGLKKHGVEFYGDKILNPLLKKESTLKIWLYDLTAWASFSSSRGCITKQSQCLSTVNQLLNPQVRCLPSALVLRKMSEEKNPAIVSYLHQCAQRNDIIDISKGYPTKGKTLKDIFSTKSLLLEPFFSWDTALAYSLIQYLETFYLIDILLEHEAANKIDPHNIVFALPSDELKYYFDKDGSFEKDLRTFLDFRALDHQLNLENINIYFVGFPYGEGCGNRPYNGPGSILKKNDITLDLLLGKLSKP